MARELPRGQPARVAGGGTLSSDTRYPMSLPPDVRIIAGELRMHAVFERRSAPQTCAAFEAALPFAGKLVHARWSGEALWIPLGPFDLGVPHENATSYPAPGQILWHPAGVSETELLVPYGPTRFASKAGQLAGSHFLTVLDATDALRVLGRQVLWSGAQDVLFELAAE